MAQIENNKKRNEKREKYSGDNKTLMPPLLGGHIFSHVPLSSLFSHLMNY